MPESSSEPSSARRPGRPFSPLKKAALGSVSLLLLFTVVSFVLWPRFRNSSTPDFLNLSTNSYEHLVELASAFEEDDPRLATNDTHAFVARHEPLFQKLSAALLQPSEAPARTYKADTMDMAEFMNLRRLANALMLRARVAEESGQWMNASTQYLDIIRLGQKIEHGPLISFLLGSAIELMALKPLEQAGAHLSSGELALLLPTLLELDESRLPFSEVLLRERYFLELNSPNLIKFLFERFSPSVRKSIASTRERHLNTEAYTLVVASSLAAARYIKDQKNFRNHSPTLSLLSFLQLRSIFSQPTLCFSFPHPPISWPTVSAQTKPMIVLQSTTLPQALKTRSATALSSMRSLPPTSPTAS